MSEYENISKEDKAWYDNLQSMKVPDQPCDMCRANPATRWFGNTNENDCT